MSSIRPDANLASAGLDRLNGQVSLDDLGRQQGAGELAADSGFGFGDAPLGTGTDPGEDTLNLSAWGDVPQGDRLLSGDFGYEQQLRGMDDLSMAADRGANEVFDLLG